ncbi:hypothetical protein H7X68_03065 [Candidatus Saccharibacteria bacterium]|nr:hypothetical protein [Candidatus Saccharibacteria bacterium]
MNLENNQQNKDINTKSHHAGNAPEHMREVPQEGNDFDNTSLREAVDRGLVDTEHRTLPKSWAESHPDTKEKGFTRKRQFLAGMAATALALGIGVGANAMNSKDERVAPVTPVATAEANPPVAPVAPEVTATPEETADETIDSEASAIFELNKKLSIESFNKRPRDERLGFVWSVYSELAETGNLSDFMDQKLGDGEEVYEHNPAIAQTPAYEIDNGQRIMNFQIFSEATAAAFKQDTTTGGDGPLDFKTAQKLLSGLTYDVGTKDKSDKYSGMVDLLDDSTQARRLSGFESIMALDTSKLQTGVDAEGEQIKYKDVLYNPGTGETFAARFVFKTFTGADNKEHSLWLRISTKKATSLAAN